jgi:signal transduction histidine kinase
MLPLWFGAAFFYYASILIQTVIGIALLAVPIAIGLAILRYRLYDIDVVISRTLLVAGLAAFITATYVAIVVGVGSLVGRGDEPNVVLSVLATAAVAVAFQPVRRQLQRVANRLVYGRRATPYDVLSGFATRVGAAEASPETLVGLAELMADGTGARPARVWLRVGAQLRASATWPVAAGAEPMKVPVDAASALPEADLAVPVHDQDELLGVLTIAKPRGERVSEVDVDLMQRLAAAGSVLLRNLRLDAELAARLEEIEASRRRLVSAQDDARRWIEAELGGSTRAQLRALQDQLSVLAGDIDADAMPKTAMLLDQLGAATDGALDTLAGLAAGVYPPRLAADGLVTALTEQAGRSTVRVEVEATGVGRYGAEVEAAVYFAVLEALQNVAKYADAETSRIRLAQQGDRLTFEVTDDGVGFDTETAPTGSGLQGIIDRLDTVGGTVTIVSEPGTGTTVAGSVPTASSPPAEQTQPRAGAIQ